MTRDLGEQNLTLLEQGRKAATKIAFDASLPEGSAPGEATVEVGTEIKKGRFDLGIAAWVKRKFMRGGTSAGVRGEIKF